MQLQETITKGTNSRPLVAIGHVRLLVTDVPQATEFFLQLGLRQIHHSETLAVLELRGGTHLVLRPQAAIAPGAQAPFDLMVDDVVAARQTYAKLGLTTSEIETGRTHSSFTLTGPDGYLITVTSSHTAGRIV